MSRLRSSLALLFFVLVLAGAAQSQTTPTEVVPTPAPAPVPLQEVPERSQEVIALLRDIEDNLQPKPEIDAIRQELPKFTGRIDQLQVESTEILRNSPSRLALDRLEALWQSATPQLTKWRDALTAYSGQLESLRDQLVAMRGTWNATREAAGREAPPPAIVARIKETVNAIRDTRKSLEAKRDEILLLQDQVAKLLARDGEVRREITRLRQQLLTRLIERDGVPLWRIDWSALTARGTVPQTADSLSQQLLALRDYLIANGGYVTVHLLLFAGLIPLLMAVRKRISGWVERNPQVARAMPVVALPVSSAMLASTLTVIWFYPPGPRIFAGLLSLLSLVPTVRILRRLVDRVFLPVVHTFAAFFLIDRLRRVFDWPAETMQVLFIIQMTVSIAAVLWLVLTRRLSFSYHISGAVAARAIEYASRALVGVFTLSLIAACLGYMRLADWLASGFLVSGYIAIGMYATYRVGQGVVAFAVRSGGGRLLNITQHPIVERRITTLLRWLVIGSWLGITLLAFDLLTPVAQGLRTIVTAELRMGEVRLSLGDIILFCITIWAAFALSRFIRFILAEDVYPRFSLARGVPYAVSTLVHYTLLIFGFFLAFAAMGLDLNRFTILAGAFGVGIGFGMQNIINNFISGIILLFERPIQVGDVVQLGVLQGEVTRIGIRSSAIRTAEGAEVIVPNASFISDTVTNWTLSDRLRRIDVAVGVAYGSDPAQVLTLLRDIATNHPLVLTEPPPAALFISFGDSALNFELRIWTNRFEEWVRIRSELNIAVHDALGGANIVIPFPRREVTVDAPVDVRIVRPKRSES